MMPAEVVVAVVAPDGEAAARACRAVTATLGDLADLGVMVAAIPGTLAGRDADHVPGVAAPWVPDAAKQARSPWVVPWQADREYDASHLLDLACARECAQADVVGQAGLAYAYVTSLEPTLARREFFGPDGSGHGLRFFSIG
jgi:hypothetical protein